MRGKRDTRKRILDSAIAVFGAKSFHKATVRDIARGAGLGIGTIYSYFPSKEAVLLVLIADGFAELSEILRRSIEGIDSPLEKLRKFTWTFLGFFEENRSFGCIVYLVMPIKEWSEAESFHAMREPQRILVRIVREGQERGFFRQDIDLNVLVYTYFGGLGRIIAHREIDLDQPSLLAYFPDFYEITLRGIAD